MGPGVNVTALGAPVCPLALLLSFFQGPGHLGWPRLCKGKSQEQGHTRWIDRMVGSEREERGGKGALLGHLIQEGFLEEVTLWARGFSRQRVGAGGSTGWGRE